MGFIGKQPSKTAITSSDITDGVVTADKLASDSVTTAKIADNGVTTAKINADAVTDAKIADDVVGTEHLTAGEVDTTALGADAVTAAKIADDAISDEHLDPTAITGQTAETSVADDDLVFVSDTSASAALKKMTVSNLVANAGGGKILQVIEDTLEAEFESSSTSYVETGLSVNITPSSTSSKILILGNAAGDTKGDRYIYATIFRDSTNLSSGTGADGFAIIHEGNSARLYGALPVMKLDSPNTTSQVTYTLRARTNSGTFRITQHNQTSVIIVMEVGA